MPYKLQKTEDGYYVLNEDGKRKSNKPMPRSRAVAYMRALYAAEKRTMSKEGEPEGEYKSDDYRGVILGVAKKHIKKNTVQQNNIIALKRGGGKSGGKFAVSDLQRRAIFASLADKLGRGNRIANTGMVKKIVGNIKFWKKGLEDKTLSPADKRRYRNWIKQETKKLMRVVDKYEEDGYAGKIGALRAAGLKEHADQPAIFVFKQSNGQSRWVTYSSNAFKDRDQEIVSTAALEADVARADKEGDYGPLRWWHVGQPDPFAKLPGAGADIGKCDYNAVHGRILVESGTFADERIAEAVKAKAHELQVSIGFFHPRNEPVGGVFNNIRRFERSLLPRGRASNPWTSMLVVQKEGGTMLKEKIQALKVLLGGDDELVQSVLEKAEQTQKAAEEAGIEFKGEDPQPETETPATEKAEDVDLTELADQETLEELADEVSEADLEPVIGDMTVEEYVAMEAEIISKALEPHVKEISKLKISYSQKDDEVSSLKEALTLQAQTINALKAQLDELTGSQPRAATKGYRASQADETVVKQTSRVAGSKPTVDAGFLDFAIGKQP